MLGLWVVCGRFVVCLFVFGLSSVFGRFVIVLGPVCVPSAFSLVDPSALRTSQTGHASTGRVLVFVAPGHNAC